MLNFKYIAQDVTPYSEKWFSNRIKRITSSKFSCLCSYENIPNELPKGAISYLDTLQCEGITGKSNSKNYSNDAIVHGVETESIAIKHYQQSCIGTENEFAILNKNQILPNEFEGSTPDSIIIRVNGAGYNSEKGEVDAETLEIKCPSEYYIFRAYSRMIEPKNLKSFSKDYYWQVIHQMISANVRFGNFVTFHPDFIGKDETKIKPMYHLKFDAMELREDVKFAKLRTKLATDYLQKF